MTITNRLRAAALKHELAARPRLRVEHKIVLGRYSETAALMVEAADELDKERTLF